MATIGKINLGQKDKREFFDMSHDVNTTMSVGFVEPTMCMDVIPNTKVDIQAHTGVRLAPLPQPTTGTLKLKQYYSFVKTEDVFEAFENLQSQTAVSSSRSRYIPTNADTISNAALLFLLMSLSNRNYKETTSYENINNSWVNSVFFRYSIHSTYDLMTGEYNEPHNLWDDVNQAWIDTDSTNNRGWIAMTAFFQTLEKMTEPISRALYSALKLNVVETQNIFTQFKDMPEAFASFIPLCSNLGTPSDMPYSRYLNFCHNIAPANSGVFEKSLSMDNADFYFELPSTGINLYIGGTPKSARRFTYDPAKIHNYVGIHLTPAGKRLFKILNCVGVTFRYNMEVELPKLYAYYKAWFDIFNPGRNSQWKDTYCYELIHSFYDSPDFNVFQMFLSVVNSGFSAALPSQYRNAVKRFFESLPNCFYTEKVNPITVATRDAVQNTPGGSNSLDNADSSFILYDNHNSFSQSVNDGYGSGKDTQGGLSVVFLQTLYNWVNKNSVIGQRVAQYMKEHFGIDVPRSTFIDKDSFDVFITDSVATVNNDQTALGEYAGLGKGRATGQPHKYECLKHGYFFQFSVVVPVGGYVQTAKLGKRGRFDWYQQAFDSKGMAPISKAEVFSRNSWLDKFQSDNPKFGMRPRYFEFKYMNNLANGGFSFRSDRGQFLGYSLDKLFSEPDLFYSDSVIRGNERLDARGNRALKAFHGVDIEADEYLRFVGQDEQFGNYDRIFYDTTGNVDNFIVYIRNNVKMWAPMKAISDSFDAYDETQDTDVVSMEHS